VHAHSASPLAGNIPPVLIGTLLAVAFWPILKSMFGSWFDPPSNMEHGILVIPAAGFMVWRKRVKLSQIPRTHSAWGLFFVLWGAGQASLGMAAHWTWISRTAFLISLTGSIAAVYGVGVVRELAYPLATLILMIAPPTFLYERFTLDLQLIAGRLGADCLELMGYPVLREGNVLEMVGIKLSVEEACSGLRSLVSIVFLCVLYNHFFVRGNLTRAVILAMAVPIAIIGNVGRIVMTGVVGQHNHELAGGFAHEALGYISVVAAGIGCIALHFLIVQIRKMWRPRQA